MPYNEFEEQARLYYQIAKEKLADGLKQEARNNFNMAYAIARKNHLNNLMSEIQRYLDELDEV